MTSAGQYRLVTTTALLRDSFGLVVTASLPFVPDWLRVRPAILSAPSLSETSDETGIRALFLAVF